jgi:hypothetical protein
MEKIKLKSIISKNPHWELNKQLVRVVGLTECLVLQQLIDLSESAFKRNEIFQPISKMAEEFGLSEFVIKQAISKLKSYGLINVARKSVGFKNFYSVNTDLVLELINGSELKINPLVSKKLTKSELKINPLVSEKLTHPVSENLTMSELKTDPPLLRIHTNNTELKIDPNNTQLTIDPKNTVPESDSYFYSKLKSDKLDWDELSNFVKTL